MIKKIKVILIVVFPILMMSCGFKPLMQKNNGQIYFQNLNVTGERRIAYSLKNNILLISDKNSKNKYDSKIEIVVKKKNKTKDSKGQITRYNLSLSATLELKELATNTTIQKTFIRKADYDVADTHSNTIDNENNARKNVTQQISDDIINYITISMRGM